MLTFSLSLSLYVYRYVLFSHLLSLLLLAAVSSGNGRHMNEGVQSFARAALAGGIPCLLATKWNVPRKESIILMSRIYAHMAVNKVRESTGLFDREI